MNTRQHTKFRPPKRWQLIYVSLAAVAVLAGCYHHQGYYGGYPAYSPGGFFVGGVHHGHHFGGHHSFGHSGFGHSGGYGH